MNIASITEEQLDALNATAAEINGTGGDTTAQTLLEENGLNFVNARVEHYYQLAVNRVATAWRSKSYTERKATLAQLEGTP